MESPIVRLTDAGETACEFRESVVKLLPRVFVEDREGSGLLCIHG